MLMPKKFKKISSLKIKQRKFIYFTMCRRIV